MPIAYLKPICTFCGEGGSRGRDTLFIAGAGVAALICDSCVDVCAATVAERRVKIAAEKEKKEASDA